MGRIGEVQERNQVDQIRAKFFSRREFLLLLLLFFKLIADR